VESRARLATLRFSSPDTPLSTEWEPRVSDRSSMPRSDEATALALDFLDAAARSKTEGRLGDAKIVDAQHTKEATEDLRQVGAPLPCSALSA
jgi:hypothetical protein